MIGLYFKVTASVLLLSLSIAKSEIILTGTAQHFAGKRISIYEYEDFFTRTRVEMQNSLINAAGDFTINYPLVNPRYIEISLNEIFSGLYVRPHFNYQIFFNESGKVEQVISNDDTNTVLKAFEEVDFALYKYQKKKIYADKIELFVQEQKGKLRYNAFLNTILTYRIARREYWICESKGDIAHANRMESELLLNKPINNDIPDYFYFLKAYTYGRQNTLALRRTPFNGKDLIKTFLDEGRAIPNDSIQQFAILTILEKAYQSDWGRPIPKGRINQLIDSLAQVAVSPEVENTAKLILRKNNSLRAGDGVEDFLFETSKGQSLNLSSLKGKYVLIDFWFVGCSSCIENFPRLKKLKENHESRLEIVSLTPYDTKERINTFLNKHSQYDWLFSPINKKSELLDYFNILYYPTYYLISPEGKLIKQIINIELEDEFETVNKLIN